VPDVPRPKEGDSVTTGHPEPETRYVGLDVTRALYDALMEARPHVEEAQGWYSALLLDSDAQTAAEVLERVDGALADAGEVFGGQVS